MPDPAESELLANVARGDTEAFGQLYDRLAGPLFSLAADEHAVLKAKVLARIAAAVPPTPPARQRDFYFIGRSEGEWQTLPIPGVRVKTLSVDERRGRSTKLYELAPGAHFPKHRHSGPEECFVVSGDFHVAAHFVPGLVDGTDYISPSNGPSVLGAATKL